MISVLIIKNIKIKEVPHMHDVRTFHGPDDQKNVIPTCSCRLMQGLKETFTRVQRKQSSSALCRHSCGHPAFHHPN